jgi:death-on-curing protein
MDKPTFLTLEQVHRLHDRALAEHGGQAGVREPGLVDSALASAQNAYWYARGDLFDIAAAYAFHLAEAQAFIDCNKRVAVATALTFLKVNGVAVLPDAVALEHGMLEIARHRLDKQGFAELLHVKHLELCLLMNVATQFKRQP